MRRNTESSNFVRFLKDERFIEWKISPNAELDEYWKEFLLHHPHEQQAFELAEKHFRNINLSSYKLPREKKDKAIQHLEKSLRTYRQRQNFRRFSYVAAASAAVLILLIGHIQKRMIQSSHNLVAATEYIIGNELEQKDILFITGGEVSAFQGSVDIEIDDDQTAKVRSKDMESANEAEIVIEKHTMNHLIIPYGKRSEIILSDGSRLWLNSGSSIEFPSSFSSDSREISLTGEMYIEVAPDKKRPFIVHTPDYNVRVYGTKFNIATYSESPSSVILIEGSVGVQAKDTHEIVLSPNEQIIYSEESGTFTRREVDAHALTSWKDGYLTFEDAPITEALKQIERYYNFSFNLDDDVSFQGLTCTGKIILSDNLDNVMTALTLISSTHYKREDKLIYIYKNNSPIN